MDMPVFYKPREPRQFKYGQATHWYQKLPSHPISKSAGNRNTPARASSFSGSGEMRKGTSKHVPSFKGNQYTSKSSSMFPRLEKEFRWQESTQKPDDFKHFMQNTFTWPNRSEILRFPEQPNRLVKEKPSKKPRKRDMMTGLKGGKVEGRKRNSSNSSHADHRDTPGKFPLYIRHILDASNRANEGATVPNKTKPELPENLSKSLRALPSRPSIDIERGRGRNHGLVDVLDSLGPDQMQQLKQLLGAIGNEGGREDDSSRRRDDQFEGRSMSTLNKDNSEEHSPAFTQDVYNPGPHAVKKESRKQHLLGNSLELVLNVNINHGSLEWKIIMCQC